LKRLQDGQVKLQDASLDEEVDVVVDQCTMVHARGPNVDDIVEGETFKNCVMYLGGKVKPCEAMRYE
jgi:hypothetical protein